MSFESQLIFKHNNGSEFRSVILNVEPILLALNYCVTPADTDVIDSNLTFMASSKFEFGLSRSYS